MRKRTICITFLTVLTLVAPALATPPGMVGERNFERALRSEWANKDMKKAEKYYSRAANALATLMEENHKDGVNTRVSRLIMAGISQFKTGRYPEAAATMRTVATQDRSLWEAWLYGGLAYAMTGNSRKALDMWRRFPPDSGQRYLLPAIRAQVAALEAEEKSPRQAAKAVLSAVADQFHWNYFKPKSRRSLAAQDDCSGRFWWRYHYSPCDPRVIEW